MKFHRLGGNFTIFNIFSYAFLGRRVDVDRGSQVFARAPVARTAVAVLGAGVLQSAATSCFARSLGTKFAGKDGLNKLTASR